MDKKQDKHLRRCHFCERHEGRVGKMIAGLYANICSDCVVKCVEVLAEVEPRQGDNQ